jgi:hypothetical protein
MTLSRDDAESLLKQLIIDEQRRLQLLLAPYIEELSNIEARKPPCGVTGSDGLQYVYCGPTAEDILGRYKAPKWLENIASNYPDRSWLP